MDNDLEVLRAEAAADRAEAALVLAEAERLLHENQAAAAELARAQKAAEDAEFRFNRKLDAIQQRGRR